MKKRSIPGWIHMVFAALTIVAMIPPVLIARARGHRGPTPRIHPIWDMDNQERYKAQAEFPGFPESGFADQRAMRPPVEGTVARGELRIDPHYHAGFTTDAAGRASYHAKFPEQVTVSMDLLERGEERLDIYCAPCHGFGGYGDGPVADARRGGLSEIADLNLHTAERRAREVGYIFNVISKGNSNMPGYASAIPVADRWAITAWLKVLQESQATPLSSLPAARRNESSSWPDFTPPPVEQPGDTGTGNTKPR